MRKKQLLTLLLCLCTVWTASAQVYNEMDEDGNVTQRNENRNFNMHSTDTTRQAKDVPKGIRVWTVDRRFGDVQPAEVDTLPHLFQNSIFNTGYYGEYNTTGNNYSPRQSRVFIDRPETDEFFFTQPYSYIIRQPDDFHFTNTLSPFTNITYDNCGNKTNGEDHIGARFGVNAGKKIGIGFDLNYLYARGYYQNQSASHFNAALYGSYIGDRYQMHILLQNYHQKVAENGGITDDNYITHPETFEDSYSEDEIPTILSRNWNRNNSQHLFLSHRYNIGFYRKVKMTDEEIRARQFAKDAAADKQRRTGSDKADARPGRPASQAPTGRPDNARIAGDEPTLATDSLAADTTRITVDSQAKMDSLLLLSAQNDSIEATMKRIYVPVTSFIHTLDVSNHSRIYQAYASPTDYYANTYYNYRWDNTYGGDSIYDQTKYLSIKNTFAVALLEGFNKYAKAGLKAFVAHDYRKYRMPDTGDEETRYQLGKWTGHTVSIGGQLSKTQGKTLHYDLDVEAWLTGLDAGQLTVDFSTDLNFPLFGDTVQLAAKAYFHRLTPTFFQGNFHSKHIWWDNDDLNSETRTRIEGVFSYRKTRTQLRVAVEEIQNFTYFGLNYDATTSGRTNLTANIYQESSNINLLTAQLRQDFTLGPLNWENIITYQNSSNQDALPVPALNIFTNLYLKFKIVKQLLVELGGDCYFFTKYNAPDFCPQLNQFAVQTNGDSRIKVGGYPFVDVYANMHLKRTRFFIMMSHVNASSGNYFLVPHYPQNGSILRFGLSWNFFN
ncbi:MAG: putative porin [Prevotella sp.]|nr:putative porin [Prevotella sp.]